MQWQSKATSGGSSSHMANLLWRKKKQNTYLNIGFRELEFVFLFSVRIYSSCFNGLQNKSTTLRVKQGSDSRQNVIQISRLFVLSHMQK